MRGRAKGFTLMELLAAIAIAAVLSTVAFSYVGDYTKASQKTANEFTLEILNEALSQYVVMGGLRTAHSLGGANTQTKVAAVIEALRAGLTVGGERKPLLPASDAIDPAKAYVTGSGKNFNFTGYGATLSSESSKTVAGTYVPAVVASSELSGLSVISPTGTVALTPVFNSSVLIYSVTASESDSYVGFLPTAVSGADARIEVNGSVVPSGTASGNITTIVNSTVNVSIEVTGPGVASKTYNLLVTRPVDGAYLSDLVFRRVGPGATIYPLSPTFVKTTTLYSPSGMPGVASSYAVTATTSTTGAGLEVSLDGSTYVSATSGVNFSTPMTLAGYHTIDVRVTDPYDSANKRVYRLTMTL